MFMLLSRMALNVFTTRGLLKISARFSAVLKHDSDSARNEMQRALVVICLKLRKTPRHRLGWVSRMHFFAESESSFNVGDLKLTAFYELQSIEMRCKSYSKVVRHHTEPI